MAQTTKTKVNKRSNVGIQTAVSASLAVDEQEVTVDSTVATDNLAATSSLEAPQEKIPGPLKDLPEGFLKTTSFLENDLPYLRDTPFLMQVPYNPIPPKIRTQYEYYKDRDCSFQTLNSFGEQGWQLTTTFTLPDTIDGKPIVYYIFMREKQSA